MGHPSAIAPSKNRTLAKTRERSRRDSRKLQVRRLKRKGRTWGMRPYVVVSEVLRSHFKHSAIVVAAATRCAIEIAGGV
jgi:hypothetical protein